MRARELKQLLTMTARLTPYQRSQLQARLASDMALDEALALIESTLPGSSPCPACHDDRVVRNGQATDCSGTSAASADRRSMP